MPRHSQITAGPFFLYNQKGPSHKQEPLRLIHFQFFIHETRGLINYRFFFFNLNMPYINKIQIGIAYTDIRIESIVYITQTMPNKNKRQR